MAPRQLRAGCRTFKRAAALCVARARLSGPRRWIRFQQNGWGGRPCPDQRPSTIVPYSRRPPAKLLGIFCDIFERTLPPHAALGLLRIAGCTITLHDQVAQGAQREPRRVSMLSRDAPRDGRDNRSSKPLCPYSLEAVDGQHLATSLRALDAPCFRQTVRSRLSLSARPSSDFTHARFKNQSLAPVQLISEVDAQSLRAILRNVPELSSNNLATALK